MTQLERELNLLWAALEEERRVASERGATCEFLNRTIGELRAERSANERPQQQQPDPLLPCRWAINCVDEALSTTAHKAYVVADTVAGRLQLHANNAATATIATALFDAHRHYATAHLEFHATMLHHLLQQHSRDATMMIEEDLEDQTRPGGDPIFLLPSFHIHRYDGIVDVACKRSHTDPSDLCSNKNYGYPRTAVFLEQRLREANAQRDEATRMCHWVHVEAQGLANRLRALSIRTAAVRPLSSSPSRIWGRDEQSVGGATEGSALPPLPPHQRCQELLQLAAMLHQRVRGVAADSAALRPRISASDAELAVCRRQLGAAQLELYVADRKHGTAVEYLCATVGVQRGTVHTFVHGWQRSTRQARFTQQVDGLCIEYVQRRSAAVLGLVASAWRWVKRWCCPTALLASSLVDAHARTLEAGLSSFSATYTVQRHTVEMLRHAACRSAVDAAREDLLQAAKDDARDIALRSIHDLTERIAAGWRTETQRAAVLRQQHERSAEALEQSFRAADDVGATVRRLTIEASDLKRALARQVAEHAHLRNQIADHLALLEAEQRARKHAEVKHAETVDQHLRLESVASALRQENETLRMELNNERDAHRATLRSGQW